MGFNLNSTTPERMAKTMFSPQKSRVLSRITKFSFGVGAVCLAVAIAATTLIAPTNAQTKRSKYGLGLPKVTSSGGVRGNVPSMILLAPIDGGRTLSPRPTFYWYVSSDVATKKPYQLRFNLRDREGESVFKIETSSTKTGLQKFTLPDSAPALKVGKVMRWQLRLTTDLTSSSNDMLSYNALIELKPPSSSGVKQDLEKAKNGLEKARVYAKYSYWYDALDAYTNWVESNPKEASELDNSRQERTRMISIVVAELMNERLQSESKISDLSADDWTKLFSFLSGLVNVTSATQQFGAVR
jgi:hypothetical protein